MKRLFFASVVLLATGFTAFAQTTPISQFGSNPWFSSELFPQDVLLRAGNYMFYNPEYFNKPFWGDIDEPEKKPNTHNDYTITGVNVVRNGGDFKHSGTVHTLNNNFGYAWRPAENMMSTFSLDYDVDALRNRASGTFTGSDSEYYPDGATLPFEYSMRHTIYRLSMNGMLGMNIADVPVGVMIDGGMENTMALNKDLSFSKLAKNADGTFSDSMAEYSMTGDEARAFWGWTEPGCSHPFGARGTQGDSWMQDEYATGPVYHVNVTGGATFPRVKAGGYFRYRWGHQVRYYWDPSGEIVANDSVISRNFIGSYMEDTNQVKINRTGEGRLFGNVKLRGNDRFSVNTFAQLSYFDSTLGSAAADNLEAESSSKSKIRAVAMELDPNISVKLGQWLNFIDAAALFRYQYSRYSNITDRWVGGGELTTYWDTHVREGWEDSWESFSFANQHTVDIGADISAMFPLFTGRMQQLSFNLRLFGDVRFTYQNKHYGTNTVSGSNVTFNEEGTRLNLTREVMFNTFLMLHYVQGPYQLQLRFTEPVLYSVALKTSVNHEASPPKKSGLWITKEGMSVALFGSYDFTLPFLRAR